jgi:GT2 family glycosyltransferase
MDEYPILAAVMVTYRRTDLALRTVRGLGNFLAYPHEKVAWYVADDGSPKEHVDAILKEIIENGFTVLGYHNQKFAPGTYNAGKGWNIGLNAAHTKSPFVLWMEDDWELRRPLALSPYLQLLHDREDVGMVRLGHMAVGSQVEIVGYRGIHYLNYLRTTSYAYSGNPHIRHIRFSEAVGPFAEDRNPGEIELDQDHRFRVNSNVAAIWRPADIPGWGIFGHLGTEKSFQ